MSLLLERPGTDPSGIWLKTYDADTVFLGGYTISIEDFLIAVNYVLTNTNLKADDLRVKFLEYIKGMQPVEGHGGEGLRLESTALPFI